MLDCRLRRLVPSGMTSSDRRIRDPQADVVSLAHVRRWVLTVSPGLPANKNVGLCLSCVLRTASEIESVSDFEQLRETGQTSLAVQGT